MYTNPSWFSLAVNVAFSNDYDYDIHRNSTATTSNTLYTAVTDNKIIHVAQMFGVFSI